MYDLIIRDATIVHAGGRRVADIAVEDGRICEVGGKLTTGAREVLAGIGRFVVPGFIDSQVRCQSAADPRRDDVRAASRAAVSAGVTSLIDLPDGVEPLIDRAGLQGRREAAERQSLAWYGSWIGAGRDGVSEALDAVRAGLAIAAFARMDLQSGPLSLDEEALSRLLEGSPAPVGVHAEDGPTIEKCEGKWAQVEDALHSDVRPLKAATEALGRLIRILATSGGRAHLTSLSTAAELNLLDPTRGALLLSSAVSPSHLVFSLETAGKQVEQLKFDPPMRGEVDRRALWAAVKRGRIEVFASGHRPSLRGASSLPYWRRPSGIPGIDTLFPLLVGAVKHGRLGLERLVEMSSEAPARLFSLARKGKIEVGYDADLVIFSERDTVKLRSAPPYSGADWSPFLGRETGGAPEVVVVGGRVVARDGVIDESAKPPGLLTARTIP